MPHEVIMPALGMAQDTGHLVAWRKEAGDKVSAGDVLMEVETDKSTVEVEAGVDGWVTELRARAGDDVPVGRTVAVIGETPDAVAPAADEPAAETPAAETPAPKAEQAPAGDPVIMPALGMAQDTGLIVSWAKAPGDPIAAGEVLLEVETDKSTMEIEAQSGGYVAEIRAAAGASVPVGEVIAVISAEKPAAPKGPGDTPAAAAPEPAAEKPATAAEPAPAPAAAPLPLPVDGRVLASPKARRLAAERGLDLARLVAEGAGQPIHVRDLDALAARAAASRATAAATTPAPAAASHAARLEARAPAAPLDAFTAWLAAESGGTRGRAAVLAAFAAAGLRAGHDRDGALVVAVETAEGADPARYCDADRARLATLAPCDDPGAPALIVRDLLGTPIVAARAGGLATPVLTLVPTGDEIALALDYTADALDDRAAIALVTALAGRLAEPLRHLL